MNALTGIGVAVTREEPVGGPLGLRLAERGARVHLWPTVRSVPPSDPAPLADALARLDAFDWIVCTSARAVEALPVVTSPPAPRLAAVGRGTARAARARGWAVFFGVILLETGLHDHPRHAKMGADTLRRIGEDPS